MHHRFLFIPFFGLALVFIWFGIDKFIHPGSWIFWQPAFMDGFLGISKTSWNSVLGILEILFAILLLIPKTRFFGGLFSSVYLIPIIVIGWPGDIAVRDIGLFSIALYAFFISLPENFIKF